MLVILLGGIPFFLIPLLLLGHRLGPAAFACGILALNLFVALKSPRPGVRGHRNLASGMVFAGNSFLALVGVALLFISRHMHPVFGIGMGIWLLAIAVLGIWSAVRYRRLASREVASQKNQTPDVFTETQALFDANARKRRWFGLFGGSLFSIIGLAALDIELHIHGMSFYAAFFTIILVLGAFCLAAFITGLPRLTVTPQFLNWKYLFGSRKATWASLGRFKKLEVTTYVRGMPNTST